MNIDKRFNTYIEDFVNIDPEIVNDARKSRDNMIDKIKELINKDDELPNLYEDVIHFGSFNRKTKCRKLDDIDLMVCLNSEGNTANIHDSIDIIINTKENAKTLNNYLNDKGKLSSIKLTNKIKSIVQSIPEFSRSEIKRDGEAVVLNLISYEWSFDLVIAFATVEFDDGLNYYLIPDGKGNWKRTQPIVDKEYTKNVNDKYESGILEFVRIVKKINQSRSIRLYDSSYLLECFILKMFDGNLNITGLAKLQVILNIVNYLVNHNYNPIYDPKGIQGDINNEDLQVKQKREKKLKEIRDDLNNALINKDIHYTKSVEYLQKVFGKDF
jgi:hypothetical protein